METETVTTVAPVKLAKTSTVTLRAADGSVMFIVAERMKDSARTYVQVIDAAKKSTRGMTEQHADFDAAKSAIAALASRAEKQGWTRRAAARGFEPKPDAFASLPTAPKAAKGKK